MDKIPEEIISRGGQILSPKDALGIEINGGSGVKYVRFLMSALSSIPWVGAFINLTAELEQDKVNTLVKLWLEEHEKKIEQLKYTLKDIVNRLSKFEDTITIRLESDNYLELVKATFKTWDQVHTDHKKEMLKKLIINAGASTIYDDNIIRLFIKWIEQYHETHFSVIGVIYQRQEVTRKDIWDEIDGTIVREDSDKADLFRYLIRDLSEGGIIRQKRERSTDGRFYKKTKSRGYTKPESSDFMETTFEDTKLYELTELGKQFVHFVLDDVVTQLSSGNN